MEKTTALHNTISSQSDRLKFWTRDSSVLLGVFFLTIILILYFWWPLAAAVVRRMNYDGRWWLRMDWLLVGIFAFMSVAIVARANIKKDALLFFVGLCGGLVIEAWGTQTSLWTYYTSERPPLWIIPAWPIANLCIDRITRTMDYFIRKMTKGDDRKKFFMLLYWILFISFMILMLLFVAPTFDKSYTIFSLLLCTVIILTPKDHRTAVLIFIAGTALGYFLELWGTTRHCWTYYTHETPPVFAVLAHGMAAVAFWRAAELLIAISKKINSHIGHPGHATTTDK